MKNDLKVLDLTQKGFESKFLYLFIGKWGNLRTFIPPIVSLYIFQNVYLVLFKPKLRLAIVQYEIYLNVLFK